MNRIRLILQSLKFYRKTNLAVLAGVLISSAVLTGALIIGDSVRYSLVRMAELRTGNVEHVMLGGERLFTSELSEKTGSVPVLLTQGVSVAEKNGFRVNKTSITGFGPGFWKAGNCASTPPELKEDEVYINRRLSEKTGAAEGDELLIKIRKPDAIPGDMTLTPKEARNTSFRVIVKKVLSPEEFGDFSIRNSQVPPCSVFIPLKTLNKKLELKNRANVLLFTGSADAESIKETVKKHFTPEDISLKIRKTDKSVDIISDRIFIDQYIENNLEKNSPLPNKILTYFVNSMESSGKELPYSFIASFQNPPSDIPEIRDDEIVLNKWAADDMGLKPGDKITLTFFIPDKGDSLEVKKQSFTIRSIIKIEGSAADKNLMPVLPGIVDEDNCRDWDPGIPIDLSLIRKKDEDYWTKYKGTPKGFISFNSAVKLWKNRFGNITILRFPSDTDSNELIKNIRTNIDPESLGFRTVAIKEEGVKAGTEAVDFGQLFLGLSFFIIAAALLLTALLASLSAEQRRSETGTLMALGFTKRSIRSMLFIETTVLAFTGALLGTGAGILYNKLVLWFLGNIWKGATGTSNLHMFIKPESLLIGFSAGFITALISIWFTIKKQSSYSIAGMAKNVILFKGKVATNFIVSLLLLIAALYLMFSFQPQLGKDVSAIFQGAGFLLLGALVAAYRGILQLNARSESRLPDFNTLSKRNVALRSGRNITATALLAAGVFIIASVGANRHTTGLKSERNSGTGGFGLIGELSVPVKYDLNKSTVHGVNLKKDKVSFLQFRTRKGDDASCLNLNRISRPTIIATDPEELYRRKAFSFAGFDKSIPEINRNWHALYGKCKDGTIPAIADMTVIIWGLGKKPGDIVEYTNEKGEKIRLKLIAGLKNSIFQGNIIISEENFIANFPSNSGSEFILIDVPLANNERVMQTLARTMEDYGAEFSTTSQRLAEYNTIENTYLSIFLALGGLGLLIGTIGIGTVLIRNINERRSELALLMAAGFKLSMVRKLLIKENLSPFMFGIISGTIAAGIAILPSLLTSGKEIPWLFLATTIALIILNGIYWINRAVKKSCSTNITQSLRND